MLTFFLILSCIYLLRCYGKAIRKNKQLTKDLEKYQVLADIYAEQLQQTEDEKLLTLISISAKQNERGNDEN